MPKLNLKHNNACTSRIMLVLWVHQNETSMNMNKPIYRAGYEAFGKGMSRSGNPFCVVTEIEAYCEWAQGFNAALRGFK